MPKIQCGRSFTVTMGQGFRYSLPEKLRQMGGRVWSAQLDESSTQVDVHVTFPQARTLAHVQDALWDEWPMCSVGVTINK